MASNRALNRWNRLNRDIATCAQCPRLLKHCQEIAERKRRAYQDWDYWGKPVPNFGDEEASLLIVGLAPGAHGANRTGRMFTGDRSGDWLYGALAETGFANQAESVSGDDGLQLRQCAISAVCHCAPPDNKPTGDEILSCRPWLAQTIDLLPVRVIVALGQIAWNGTFAELVARGWHSGRRPKFGHGVEVALEESRWILGCYHPSQQNTFTGRLTESMLKQVFQSARKRLVDAG